MKYSLARNTESILLSPSTALIPRTALILCFALILNACSRHDSSEHPSTDHHLHVASELMDDVEALGEEPSEESMSQYNHVFQMELQSIDGVAHWKPVDYHVKPGDKVLFEVSHNVEGGFDFHGFAIPALNIARQINRGRLARIEVNIPENFAEGEYNIDCHFHPAHIGAKLIVQK